MYLDRKLVQESAGFAIESYRAKMNLDSNAFKDLDGLCMNGSSVKIRNLIDECDGNLVLRELTDEERGQVQHYKEEQNSKSGCLKASQSVAFDYFDFNLQLL